MTVPCSLGGAVALLMATDAAILPDDALAAATAHPTAIAAVITTAAAEGNGAAFPATLVTVHPAVLVSAGAQATAEVLLAAGAMVFVPAAATAATAGVEPPPDPA